MTRRLGLLMALFGAMVALVAPQPAFADSVDGDAVTPQATVWYDPITHPVPHDVATQASVMRPLASGGGCSVTYGANSCISYRGSTASLNADFYVNSWDHVSSVGTAYLYIVVNGGSNYRYSATTDYVGHYPVSSLGVGGSGYAYTVVDFYDAAGNFLMSAYSPNQYYP